MGSKALETVCKKGKALIPYLTFGYPSVEASFQAAQACIQGGADVIELGFPFSDPIADGPIVQMSHQEALKTNPEISLDAFFDCVKKLKKETSTPIVLMAATNLLMQYGITAFFTKGAQAGLDGVIIPDLAIEEIDHIKEAANKNNIAIILLVSPLTPEDRLAHIVEEASGFIYLISSLGTTGERDTFSQQLKGITEKIKEIKEIPVMVGFGVHQPEQYHNLCTFADGVIVGSHLIKIINESTPPYDVLTQRLQAFKCP